MSEEKMKRSDQIEDQEDQAQKQPDELSKLIQRFDEKKEEVKEQKDTNARFTGITLFNTYAHATGENPFTGEQAVDENGFPIGHNLDSRKYPDSPLFATKLNKNLKETKENLAIINGILPSLDEEESEQFQEFREKKTELVKKNIGNKDLSNFSEASIEKSIEQAGNKEIYKNGLKELKEEYKEVLDKNQEIAEERMEILKKPLAKCEFDKITEEDTSKTDLSVEELQAIDIFLNF